MLSLCSTAQFGPWNFGPQHGFARVVRWTLERSPERLPSGDMEAVFSLMDNEITRSMWNYPWVYLIAWVVKKIFVTWFFFTASASRTDWSCARRSFTSTSACTTRARTLRSRSTCCCTRTWRCRTCAGVRSPACTGVPLSIRCEACNLLRFVLEINKTCF